MNKLIASLLVLAQVAVNVMIDPMTDHQNAPHNSTAIGKPGIEQSLSNLNLAASDKGKEIINSPFRSN